ncbi:MAG: sigma-70 family RNA polymerase sigma factor [Pirellulaceae bacterium]|nr:sigma-70 family RNA polymerase sigma factor [Pirellulaceae bacterium]
MSSESDPLNENSSVPSILLANHRRFLRFLEQRVGSREDAEEILQTAFVRSLDKGAEIRERESSVAWFYRLLRNAVIDHYRRNAANQRKIAGFAQQLSDSEQAIDSATEKVICECIHELIPRLKPEYAELISRVDLQGSDVISAADALGITAGNARVRLHRARAALRLEVERACRTCATHGCMDCTCSKSQNT